MSMYNEATHRPKGYRAVGLGLLQPIYIFLRAPVQSQPCASQNSSTDATTTTCNTTYADGNHHQHPLAQCNPTGSFKRFGKDDQMVQRTEIATRIVPSRWVGHSDGSVLREVRVQWPRPYASQDATGRCQGHQVCTPHCLMNPERNGSLGSSCFSSELATNDRDANSCHNKQKCNDDHREVSQSIAIHFQPMTQTSTTTTCNTDVATTIVTTSNADTIEQAQQSKW